MAKQFDNVCTSRGAPMGRREDSFLETETQRYVRLFQVRIDRGGYDDGGAYWGLGQPLFCALDGDGNRQFTRASSRTQAALILDIPTDALHKPLADWHTYGLAVLDGRAPMPEGKYRADVVEWLKRCGAAMGQSEDMRPKPYGA